MYVDFNGEIFYANDEGKCFIGFSIFKICKDLFWVGGCVCVKGDGCFYPIVQI